MLAVNLLICTALFAAGPESEVVVELKNCTDAQAGVLFGVKGSGCLIYDVRKNEAKTEIELCGGLMVGVALKVGGGVALNHHKIVCIKLVNVFDGDDAKKAKEFLESDKKDSKAVRELMKQRTIEELRKQGVDEQTLKKIKEIQFEPFKDATKRTQEIRKTLDECKPPEKDIPKVS